MRKTLRSLATIVTVFLIAAAAYYLYDLLRVRDSSELIAQVIHEEDRRQLSPLLKDLLRNEDPVVRARAALAVGRIGTPPCCSLLIDLIEHDLLDVARQAAFAIGLTEEKQFAPRLLDIGYDMPAAIGAVIVEAAGRLADSSQSDVADQLVDYLDHPSPDVREQAVLALFRAGARSHTADLMALASKEPDEQVRMAILYALVRLKMSEAYDMYVKYLADSDPFVRSLAVRGVGLSESSRAVHYLAIAMNDQDKGVAAEAITALSKKKDKEAKTQLADRLRRETDEKLLVHLLAALRHQENDGAIYAAESFLTDRPTDNIIAETIKYLASIKKGRAVNLIDSLSTVGTAPIKAACAEAYQLVGGTGVTSRIAVLFNDNEPVVRAAAFSSLMKTDSANSDFYITKALADSDYVLQSLAIDQIGKRRLSKYLDNLNSMMTQGTKLHIDLRRSLVECAGAFLEDNASDSMALSLLATGAIDREYVVRRAAATVYRDVIDKDRSDVIRSARTRISIGDIEDASERFEINPYATITTNRGSIEMVLYYDVAPLTVLNFIELAESGFYHDLIFHRVVPNFVVQGGDPRGDGWGGPGYYTRCEYSREPYRRGTVGIATSGKDTGGSQFFITLSPQPHLEGKYTVFGQVLAGMDVVDAIVPGDSIEQIVIEEGEL